METNIFGNYQCPCCGFYTFDDKIGNTYFICPVCYWEDDGIQLDNPDYADGANLFSLNQSKENFVKFGAVEERFKYYVRLPLEEEK